MDTKSKIFLFVCWMLAAVLNLANVFAAIHLGIKSAVSPWFYVGLALLNLLLAFFCIPRSANGTGARSTEPAGGNA